MAVAGQRDTKNAALIPSVRTLVDSKLGVISIGDRLPWNSIGVPPSLVLNLFLYFSDPFPNLDSSSSDFVDLALVTASTPLLSASKLVYLFDFQEAKFLDSPILKKM
ncbi:hypothetical protein B296_00004932 [Ensete ventricosum]|uniref:Uncharacterized protein n=1 Tax=Ensete ventricosum TaxID=4639 RepID=A0A427ADZ1_ENSVE|nr:hypothetical protein B296_00004932 [Ensete ventricosum]